MTTSAEVRNNVAPLETSVRHLVRIAGAIAGLPDGQVRSLMSDSLGEVDPVAVEEIILQSYLFAGFPRTLNAMRTWRSVSERRAPATDTPAIQEAADRDTSGDVSRVVGETADILGTWHERGEETCAIVYGDSYEKLRQNIRELHPALDD